MRPLFLDDGVWNKFKKEVFSWLGTPYKHLMKTKGRGADCTLFLGQCLVDFNVLQKLDYYYYPHDWHEQQREDEFLMENIVRHFIQFPHLGYSIEVLGSDKKELRGDIIGFRTRGSLSTNHAALLLDDGRMIHSSPGRGVGISMYSNKWKEQRTVSMRVMIEDK